MVTGSDRNKSGLKNMNADRRYRMSALALPIIASMVSQKHCIRLHWLLLRD